jgi:hypothetical protein
VQVGGALWGALSAALSAAIGGRVAHMSCAELGPLLAQAAEAGGRCDLRYKDIDAEGAAVVAEELSKNPAVTSLNLWKNSIAAGGAKVIASALTANTTLRELDVEGNQLGDDGARAFARALQGNRSLTKLNLAKNDLTDASAKALIVALQRNHTLLELDISKNTLVGLGMKSAIRAALKTNSHREKAMSALKELAQLAASDPASLAAVRRLAGGDGVSKQEMKALDELAQDAGLAPAATQAMHALADAQRQAQVSRAEAEKGVMAAQTAAVASSPALRISGTRPASRPASSAAVEWVAQIDPGTGKTYYWNTRTKTTTWKKPDDYPEESPDDSTDDSAESDSSFDDSDDSDGLGASEDIGRDLPDLDDDDDGDSDDGPDQNAVQQSLQKAMEAGSIAEMAIRHDGNGELVEAVACYKKAGSLLEEAADYSPQSDHFRAKAAEYLSLVPGCCQRARSTQSRSAKPSLSN